MTDLLNATPPAGISQAEYRLRHLEDLIDSSICKITPTVHENLQPCSATFPKLLGSDGPYPFNAQEDTGGPFHQNFNSILRRDHEKNFL